MCVPTSSEGSFISREFFASIEDDTNIFSVFPHTRDLVEADIARYHGIDGVVTAHLDLDLGHTVSHRGRKRKEMGGRAHMLPTVELLTALADDDVAGNDVLICVLG